MGKISDIHDLIDTTITTALPTHKEMSDPYFPETEADLTYESAYGLAVSAGTNQVLNPNSGAVTNQRDYIISLTKRVFATRRDSSAKKTAVKALLEDRETFVNKIEEDEHLGRPDLIIKAEWVSDDGIEFVRLNRNDILIVRILLQVDYHNDVPLCT